MASIGRPNLSWDKKDDNKFKKPGGNEKQERNDAVSGRKDGNRGASNTMAWPDSQTRLK